jgi:DNA mismatch repair protein MSH5
MASLKRKRYPASRNPLGASSAQRRFAADTASPVRSHLLGYETSTSNVVWEHEQGGRETETYNQADEDHDLIDDLAEIVMAVDMKEKGTVGCCFYIAREEKLSVLSDIQFGGKDLIDMCESLS